MSLQPQFKSKVLLEEIDLLTVIKNEPEIGIDPDIISPNIKDEIDIAYHVIPADLIKSEPIHKDLLESEQLGSVETTPFIKTEFENFVKTEDTSNGNLSVVSGSIHKKGNCCLNYHCNKCKYKILWGNNLEKHKVIHLKPNKIQYLCYHCPYKSNYKQTLQRHVFNHFKNGEVPFQCYICDFMTPKRNLIIEHFKKHPEHHSKWDETEYKNQVEAYTKKRKVKSNKIQYLCYHCPFKSKYKNSLKDHVFTHFKNGEIPFHCYICDFMTPKRDLIIEHFKKHPEHRSKWDETEYKNYVEAYNKKRLRYYIYCKKCVFRTDQYAKLKLHELSHETERDDQHLKYHCDQCKYKTFRLGSFKLHKLLHLKPEEIPYLCCYHCPYKSVQKSTLRIHIFRHFKNEQVPFHCYFCDFVTVKRDLVIEHFKKHPEHHSKCDKTDYKINLKLIPKIKKRCYGCKKCTFRTFHYDKLNLHELSHKTEVKMDDRYLKYRCNNCTYKTFRQENFRKHKLIHLKPEEIQYFYCYHCSYKAKQKNNLKAHILRHFKNANFKTRKRKSVTENIKQHFKVQCKSKINK